MLIEIKVNQAYLADTLNAMRVRLDREKCVLSNFRHAGDGAGVCRHQSRLRQSDVRREVSAKFRQRQLTGRPI